jgi:hypothetical protein
MPFETKHTRQNHLRLYYLLTNSAGYASDSCKRKSASDIQPLKKIIGVFAFRKVLAGFTDSEYALS